MSDPLDDFRSEVNKTDRAKPASSRRIGSRSGLLDYLSGVFGAGTLGAGLFIAIIFISPQNRNTMFQSATMTDQNPTYAATSTFQSGLPPTWTPTVLPSSTPTQTPPPTHQSSLSPPLIDTPEPNTSHSIATDAVPGDRTEYSEDEDGSPTGDHVIQDISGCIILTDEDQLHKIEGQFISPKSQTELRQPQDALNNGSLFLAEQSIDENLESVVGISDVFTPEIQYWEENILAWSVEYELDPDLIATVMQIESCGYTRAKTVSGAMGLFQVMPHHFKKDDQPYDPDTNAFRGLSWLQKTVRSSDSTSMALAGYNAGIARVKNPYLKWPAETQRYVDWGESIYQDAKCGHETSSALEHWLSKGGSALCNRAAEEQRENSN